jgi:plasmid stabilization system protein ParE
MISRIEATEAAREDLAAQSDWYHDKAGRDIAERYLDSVQQTLRMLQKQPDLGRVRKFRDSRLHGLRSSVVQGAFRVHLIFYRIEGDALVVFRVMHGMRDLPRRLLE